MFAKNDTFSMLNYVDALTPAKQKGRYICPTCGNHNLTISASGAYQCWNGCANKDIRDAIAPWNPADRNNKIINTHRSKATKPKQVPLPGSIELAKADGVAIEPATVTKTQRFDGLISIETRFDYDDGKWVVRHERTDTNGQRIGKKWYSQHNAVDGIEQFREKIEDGIATKKPFKGDALWPAYRENEADLALQNGGNCLLVVEGEPCTDAGWEIGYATTTFQGSSWSFHEGGEGHTALKCLRAEGLVIWPDNDRTGMEKAKKLAEACNSLGIWFVQLDPAAFDLPEKGDIINAIAMHGADEVRRRIEAQLQEIIANYQPEPEQEYGGGDGGDGGEPPIDPDEKFKLDVIAYANENNPFKKRRLKGEICSVYRISAKDLSELEGEITQRGNTPKAKIFTGAEFLKLESEGLQWLIPGVIPARGVSIIAGDAGAGKTTLTYDLAASILYGDEFLGESPSKTGKVLFVSSDEQPCFAQDKLINRGFKFDDQWQFITDWDVSQKDSLEQSLEDFRPQLVIVDSFAAIHRDSLFDENSSQAKSSIYWLESLATKYQCGVALIHHANKNREQKGVSKLRGSTAIAAACSAVLLLSGDGDIKTLSSPKIRGAEPFKWGIKLDPENGHYTVVDGKADDSQSKSLGDRIMALFNAKYPSERLETTQIRNEVGGDFDSLRKALDRLCKRGLLIKRPSARDHRYKVYGLPLLQQNNTGHLDDNDGVLSPPPMRSRVSGIIDETYTQQGIQIPDTIPDRYRTDTGHDAKNSTCPIPSKLDNAMDVEKLPDTPPTEGGERVSTNECPVMSGIGFDTEQASVVSTATPEPEPELKVGDRVYFTRKSDPKSPLGKKLAKTRHATIAQVFPGDRYQVSFDGDTAPWAMPFDRQYLELEVEPIQLPLIE